MQGNLTVAFFDAQFERQARGADFALNPFEKLALPFLHGKVLDMGCGLGNLSIEAAKCGCSVIALDASSHAITRIRQAALAEALPITAAEVDFESHAVTDMFDVVVAIGLFMFFPKKRALELLANAQAHVLPGGLAIVNVLVEGTTYLDMFEPEHYYLFSENELREHFNGWEVLEFRRDSFPAPGQTVKEFATVVARKPQSGS
jgi:tellurite methyltransferase